MICAGFSILGLYSIASLMAVFPPNLWASNTLVVYAYADTICIWQIFCYRRPSTQECESFMLMCLNI